MHDIFLEYQVTFNHLSFTLKTGKSNNLKVFGSKKTKELKQDNQYRIPLRPTKKMCVKGFIPKKNRVHVGREFFFFSKYFYIKLMWKKSKFNGP